MTWEEERLYTGNLQITLLHAMSLAMATSSCPPAVVLSADSPLWPAARACPGPCPSRLSARVCQQQTPTRAPETAHLHAEPIALPYFAALLLVLRSLLLRVGFALLGVGRDVHGGLEIAFEPGVEARVVFVL